MAKVLRDQLEHKHYDSIQREKYTLFLASVNEYQMQFKRLLVAYLCIKYVLQKCELQY